MTESTGPADGTGDAVGHNPNDGAAGPRLSQVRREEHLRIAVTGAWVAFARQAARHPPKQGGPASTPATGPDRRAQRTESATGD